MVAGSKGTRRYSPTVMTGEGKDETHKAMRLMLERGAPMLVTNPGAATLLCRTYHPRATSDLTTTRQGKKFGSYAEEAVRYPHRLVLLLCMHAAVIL